MAISLVETDRDEHVLVIRMCREEKRNAINRDLALAMDEALNTLDDDPDLWVGILTGTPLVFSAGSDIAAGGDYTTERGGEYGLIRRVRRTPLIAAVEGPALGGGSRTGPGLRSRGRRRLREPCRRAGPGRRGGPRAGQAHLPQRTGGRPGLPGRRERHAGRQRRPGLGGYSPGHGGDRRLRRHTGRGSSVLRAATTRVDRPIEESHQTASSKTWRKGEWPYG